MSAKEQIEEVPTKEKRSRHTHDEPKKEKRSRRSQEVEEPKRRGRSRERHESESEESDEDVVDLYDDHDYQVLSAVFETEKGRNVAEILSKIQRDVHLMATSIHQLIQLSLAAQQARSQESEDDDSDEQSEED